MSFTTDLADMATNIQSAFKQDSTVKVEAFRTEGETFDASGGKRSINEATSFTATAWREDDLSAPQPGGQGTRPAARTVFRFRAADIDTVTHDNIQPGWRVTENAGTGTEWEVVAVDFEAMDQIVALTCERVR